MKNKALMGLIATATIGTAIATPAIMNNQNTTHIVNKVLMVSNEKTNEAVVINGNSKMNLYALANGSGIVSNLSTGEMLTILGQVQNGYCKVRVQETGAVGYINVANMQNILNGNNDSFTQLSGNGQVINVSSNVRLRSNPAIGNNIIGHLTNGTILNILGKQGQWYKVSVNGQVGFIYEEYVSRNNSNTSSSSSQSRITSRTNSSGTSQGNNSSSSKTSSSTNNNNQNKSYATFSMATINRYNLYSEPNNTSPFTKLAKDQTVFILNNPSTYHIPKGWEFVRTAMGGGYLPVSALNINNNIQYTIKELTKDCSLYADTNINTSLGLQLTTGEQVFVPVNSDNSSSKWASVIAPKTLRGFQAGYLPSNILVSTSQLAPQG